MKKYKNMLNQVLPIETKSGGISVRANAYFTIDGDDLNSPDLTRLQRAGRIKFIEETKENDPVQIIDSSEIGDVVISKPKKIDFIETSDILEEEEKMSDTLTTVPKLVESNEDDTFGDEGNEKKRKRNKRREFSL
jgi:hypothetical protein